MKINRMEVESSVKGSFVFLDGNEMWGEGRDTEKQVKGKVKKSVIHGKPCHSNTSCNFL